MFRLPRLDTDPDDGYQIRMAPGRSVVVINRGTYWNTAYMVPKGGYAQLRSQGIEAFQEDFANLVGFLADRAVELASFEDMRFLEVRVNRLRRWHVPGLLLIGDAAHAMSPVGGVGINLAVQDAVAAANILSDFLRGAQHDGGVVPDTALAAVQRRRRVPTVATQAFQRLAQRFGIDRALRGGRTPDYSPLGTTPLVRKLLGRLIGVGVRPEHVRSPAVARRSADEEQRSNPHTEV